jgi:hypothetical protein
MPGTAARRRSTTALLVVRVPRRSLRLRARILNVKLPLPLTRVAVTVRQRRPRFS